MPFVVAVFADFVTGDYWIILLLLFGFFIPGVLIVFLCAWPYLLGDTFNVQLLRVGMQVLYPIGSGGIDTICDIFGAKQFHPIQHSDRLGSYFIWATVMLAVGGVTAELVYSMIANFICVWDEALYCKKNQSKGQSCNCKSSTRVNVLLEEEK